MNKYNLDDTIAAIATPIGEGGIGIVRLSGKDALNIADKIFLSCDGKRSSGFKAYTTHYGWIVNKSRDIVDEVLLTVMRAPRSYTKEDVVEINCHGGVVALRAVLELVLAQGCRVSQAGEFTKRAFLNGRIDLAQAEAVLDTIRAKTDSALRSSLGQLKGSLSKEINNIREPLLEVLSILEANIDFPEDDVSPAGINDIRLKLESVCFKLKEILVSSRQGRVLREGINVVICGKPNVGKSSLLNAILKQERSIVTPIAGTTRDTIEEIVDIKGIPVRLADTAGILKPRNIVEKKAVQRAKDYIASADLVFLLFDGSKSLSKEDRELIRKVRNKIVLAIINKIDLKQKINKPQITEVFKNIIEISAKRIKNIHILEDALVNLVYRGKIGLSESALVSNLRHIEALKKAQKLIEEARVSLDNKLHIELVAQSIKDALSHLDDILGKQFSEDLLDKIFSDFCIGK